MPERPYVDGVDVKVVTDPKALLSSLKSGQIEYAAGLSYRDMEVLVKDSKFDAVTLEGAEQQIYVGANVTVGPLKDLRVRQAIAYAIDRERIVTEVLRGVGYTINLPWPKYSPAFDAKKNASLSRDVDKAKALVADYGKVPSIKYTYSNASPLLEATAADRAVEPRRGRDPGRARPGRPGPVRQAAHRRPVRGHLDGVPLVGAVHAVDADRQRLPVQRAQERLPLRVEELHRARRRGLDVPDGTSAAAVADYAKLSDDLLGALFLIEIAVVQGQWATSAKLQGLDYTKRSELLLTDAWLG